MISCLIRIAIYTTPTELYEAFCVLLLLLPTPGPNIPFSTLFANNPSLTFQPPSLQGCCETRYPRERAFIAR